MKILQVCTTFYPAFGVGGGVPVVAYELSRGLRKKGHKVVVFTTDRFQKSSLPKNVAIDVDGVETYYFKISSKFLSKNKFFITPAFIRTTKKEVRNFDIIHMHEARTFQNAVAYHYAKKYDIPYVLQSHGSLLRIIEKQKLKKLYDAVWGYRILRDASKVIALSPSEAETYEAMGVHKNKIEIVPNGIDLSKFSILPDRGKFRKKYYIQDDEKVILYLGRLHESKGIDLIIEAFSELSMKIDNIRLILAGPDSGYKSILEEYTKKLKIRDKVIFTGLISEEEKIMALVDADIFVTPSFYGFPVTFLEACGCGLPIITTHKGDKLDWIHNKVGYVVGYNKDDLKNATLKVLTNEKLRRTFAERGRKLVSEEFNWERIAEKVEKIYLNLIE